MCGPYTVVSVSNYPYDVTDLPVLVITLLCLDYPSFPRRPVHVTASLLPVELWTVISKSLFTKQVVAKKHIHTYKYEEKQLKKRNIASKLLRKLRKRDKHS